MNKPLKLSIIIPCYNCETTLREAVASCYQQGFSPDEFEIVMVNDASRDGTYALMRTLADEYPNIITGTHEVNQGGGATRNTATKLTSAPLIFCLDSDDLLGPHMLDRMVALQHKTGADGIGIETSIKFRGTNINDVAFTNVFGYPNQVIPLESLLQRDGVMCSLYSTFLYTRHAFTVTGGYPTDHGFDTQGMAWRFLRHGLIAYTCPGAIYYHRVNFTESYYEREHNGGKTNLNWKRILLENNAILTDEAFAYVMNFNERDFETDLLTGLRKIPTVFTATPHHRPVDTAAIVAKKPVARGSLRGLFYRARRRLREALTPSR